MYLARDNAQIRESLAKKFNVEPSVVTCEGCRNVEGKCRLMPHLGMSSQCSNYECARAKGVQFCGDCPDFPCEKLHPMADKASFLPHNLKVYNLCRIRTLGVEKWAETEAGQSCKTYFEGKLNF